MSAVAAEGTAVWELTRTDLEELLHEAPGLREAIAEFLRDESVQNYLTGRQRIEPERAARWLGAALRWLGEGRLVTIEEFMPRHFQMAHGAALAIWLGILLDGIPESDNGQFAVPETELFPHRTFRGHHEQFLTGKITLFKHL